MTYCCLPSVGRLVGKPGTGLAAASHHAGHPTSVRGQWNDSVRHTTSVRTITVTLSDPSNPSRTSGDKHFC